MRFLKVFIVFLTVFISFFTTSHANENLSSEKLWQFYETWLQANYPAGKQALNAGASEQQLAKFESQIGIELPADYREFLSIHNGQHHTAAGLLVGHEFFQTSDILIEWKLMKKLLDDGVFKHKSESDPKGAIKPDWWNKNWIPITGDGAGNLICLDMSPDKNGTVGQVIDFDHETVERTVLADSFNEYINDYLSDLKSGLYVYHEEYNQIILLEDL